MLLACSKRVLVRSRALHPESGGVVVIQVRGLQFALGHAPGDAGYGRGHGEYLALPSHRRVERRRVVPGGLGGVPPALVRASADPRVRDGQGRPIRHHRNVREDHRAQVRLDGRLGGLRGYRHHVLLQRRHGLDHPVLRGERHRRHPLGRSRGVLGGLRGHAGGSRDPTWWPWGWGCSWCPRA